MNEKLDSCRPDNLHQTTLPTLGIYHSGKMPPDQTPAPLRYEASCAVPPFPPDSSCQQSQESGNVPHVGVGASLRLGRCLFPASSTAIVLCLLIPALVAGLLLVLVLAALGIYRNPPAVFLR